MRIRKKLLSIATMLLAVISMTSIVGKGQEPKVIAENEAVSEAIAVAINPQDVLANYYIKNAKYKIIDNNIIPIITTINVLLFLFGLPL